MLRQITDRSDLRQAGEIRRRIADGQADLAAAWLAETHAKVLAEESGRHLEPDEASSLAGTYLSAGVATLLAVVTDSLVAEEIAYALQASVDDLNALSRELAGINFLLTDFDASRCVLFTTDDFKLVAGPLGFVGSFVGEPRAALDAFVDFRDESHEDLHPILDRVVSYMGWVADE